MKRLTERIRENEYATGNAIIKELNIDENNEDKSYILEQQKNIINTLNNKLGKIEDLLQSYNVEDLEELDKLLGMATAYEELSKQLGCPLKILIKLVNGYPFYYEDEKGMHLIMFYNIETNTINFDDSWNDYDMELGEFGGIELPFNQYKKSFWLKEDKSE